MLEQTSLLRFALSHRTIDLSDNIKITLKERLKSCAASSLAMDEITVVIPMLCISLLYVGSVEMPLSRGFGISDWRLSCSWRVTIRMWPAYVIKTGGMT